MVRERRGKGAEQVRARWGKGMEKMWKGHGKDVERYGKGAERAWKGCGKGLHLDGSISPGRNVHEKGDPDTCSSYSVTVTRYEPATLQLNETVRVPPSTTCGWRGGISSANRKAG